LTQGSAQLILLFSSIQVFMLSPATISTCSPNPQSWRWYESETRSAIRWSFHSETPSSHLERLIKRPNLARIRCTFNCVDQAIRERADMVIAHSDRVTFWTSVAMNLRQTDIPLLSYSFNLPSLPRGARLYGLKQAVKRVQRFAGRLTAGKGVLVLGHS
jgi:hypothetical protein